MPPFATTGSTHLELTAADGVTQIPLMLVVVKDDKGRLVPSLHEQLSAADADSPLAAWLEPMAQPTWYGGCGASRNGYTQAPGCDTRFGNAEIGNVLPGPAEHPVTIPATHNSASRILAMKRYGSYLYVLQEGVTGTANTARVMRTAVGSASLSEVYPIATTVDTLSDLLVFDDGSGSNPVLWAAGNDNAGGRMHRYDQGTGIWAFTVSGHFGTARRDFLDKTFWRTVDGNAAWRMATRSANNKVSYTKPGGDPTDPTAWVEGVAVGGVSIGTSGTLQKPVSAGRHIYFPAWDGLYDLDEQGDSPNLLGSVTLHPFTGLASCYLDDYVYMSYGTNLIRVYVGGGDLLQSSPGICGPGAFTPAIHEYGGFPTAMIVDQGWLVVAQFNPNTLRTSIWWGRDAKWYPNVETANPMVWHGPLITSVGNQIVTAMQIVADTVTNVSQLWVASVPYDSTAFWGSPTSLAYFTLPTVGSALMDLTTGGNHKLANGDNPSGTWQPYCRLDSSLLTGGDKNSLKIVYQMAVGAQGLDEASGTEIRITMRGDQSPGSTSWGLPQTATAGASSTFPPVDATRGNLLQYRIGLISPQGSASPPKYGVLDAVRIDWWRVVPAFPVYTLTVQYGPGVSNLHNGTDRTFSADQVSALLKTLTESDRTVLRFPDNVRYSVKIRQVFDAQTEVVNGRARVTATIQAAILGAA